MLLLLIMESLAEIWSRQMGTFFLGMAAVEDAAQRSVSRFVLLALCFSGMMTGISPERFAAWLALTVLGYGLERLDRPPAGEGDLYLLAALALFRPLFDLLIILTCAVWLLLPAALHGLLRRRKARAKKAEKRPRSLPFACALFAAHCLYTIFAGF